MTTRAWLWKNTALLAERRGTQVPDLDELPAQLLAGSASGRVLPVPEGPFGGTTVLVVEPDQAEDWLPLEDSGVMSAHGRMNTLRIAVRGGSPSPREVLAELSRKNVLIAPALRAAPADWMRELEDEVAVELLDLTYAFLPGLGGRLHLGAPEGAKSR